MKKSFLLPVILVFITLLMPGCQNFIFGADDSYLKKILDAGFNGVYLDLVDAYEHFE